MSLPAIGSAAPDFTLPSTAGEDVSLSDHRGHNVLLAFFPLAFTGTCTAEVCEFHEDYSRYREKDTVVLPISVDSIPTLKAFAKQEGISVPILSDFHREVSRRYGTLNEERFFSNRAYVLIDREGKVRWTMVEPDNTKKRSTEELMAQVQALD